MHSPEELGLELPACKGISIGKCVGAGNGSHHNLMTPLSMEAHTHKCRDDRNLDTICIPAKWVLKNDDGSMSDLMYHEYAHILDNSIVFTCKVHLELTDKKIQDLLHGPGFTKQCSILGKPHLANSRIASVRV